MPLCMQCPGILLRKQFEACRKVESIDSTTFVDGVASALTLHFESPRMT